MAERTFTQTLTSLIPKFGTFGDNAIVRKPEFLLDVIHSAPVGLLAVDAKGSIVLFNERAKMNLSLEVASDDWIGKKLLDLVNFSSRFLNYAEDLLAGKLEPYELLELPVEGKHLTIRSKKIKGGYMLALTDVTDLKIMEAASLSATIEGQENERSRLARELHDGIGPLLSTINLHLEGIQPEIGALGKDAQRKFRSVSKLVNTLTGETRAISHALMPTAVEDLGLVTALEDVFEKTRDSADITVHFFSSGMQELGRAVIVGERSAGACLPSYFQKLPTGALFQFAVADFKTPKGVLVEGRGVIPDTEVKWNRASLLAGRDAQLEAAIQRMRRAPQRSRAVQ